MRILGLSFGSRRRTDATRTAAGAEAPPRAAGSAPAAEPTRHRGLAARLICSPGTARSTPPAPVVRPPPNPNLPPVAGADVPNLTGNGRPVPRPTYFAKLEVAPAEHQLIALGTQAITFAKTAISSGAGNVRFDLDHSGNRSFEKLSFMRDTLYPTDHAAKNDRNRVARHAAKALATGGGSCGEHAALAATELNRILPPGTPINICRPPTRDRSGRPVADDHIDHAFVVVGDLNGSRDNLLIVDAWTPGAQALLAKDFKFFTASNLDIVASFVADGRDVVTKRVPKVRTPDHRFARDVVAPPMPGQTQAKVWHDTHVTRDRQHITYTVDRRAAGTPRDLAATPAALVRPTLAKRAPAYDATTSFLAQRGDGPGESLFTLHGDLQVSVSTSQSGAPNACTVFSLGFTRVGDAYQPLRASDLGGPKVQRVRVQHGALDEVLRHLDAHGALPPLPKEVFVIDDAAVGSPGTELEFAL